MLKTRYWTILKNADPRLPQWQWCSGRSRGCTPILSHKLSVYCGSFLKLLCTSPRVLAEGRCSDSHLKGFRQQGMRSPSLNPNNGGVAWRLWRRSPSCGMRERSAVDISTHTKASDISRSHRLWPAADRNSFPTLEKQVSRQMSLHTSIELQRVSVQRRYK